MQTVSTDSQVLQLVLIDEDAVVLESLPQALGLQQTSKVVGRALDVGQGLQIARALDPQVLLADDRCFRREGMLLADFLPIRIGRVKLALFADHLSDIELQQALAIPVTGFLSKRDSIREVAAGLQALVREGAFISPRFADRISIDVSSGSIQARLDGAVKAFTNLQLQVLVHLANGLRVREVAKKMHLSAKAIESHKYRIMQRLGVHDRLGLCRWAIRAGLIDA